MKTKEEERESRLMKLGYKGRFINYEIIDWFIEHENLYVGALPFADENKTYKWECCLVVLGKPNTKTGILNGAGVGGKYNSKHDAELAGIDAVLDILESAHEDFKRLCSLFISDESEFAREIREDINLLREKGFDV